MEQALIEEIARIAGATLVDLQEGLYDRPDLLPDALHPNAEGAGILARTVYGALTGDYGGLQLPAIYSTGWSCNGINRFLYLVSPTKGRK